MLRLHLVGFTADLKDLVFAKRRAAKSGSFVVSIDERLKRTLREVEKLAAEEKTAKGHTPKDTDAARASKLTPKEIQTLLRQGKTAQEVAKLAETDISWIDRFTGPVVAEIAEVVDTVRSSLITKPRLGPSGLAVGDAVRANLQDKRIRLPASPEDAWQAVRRNGYWEVRFSYTSRGQPKVATFAFDPDRREVRALNNVAADIGWRAPPTGVAQPERKSRRSRPATKRRSTRRRTASTRS